MKWKRPTAAERAAQKELEAEIRQDTFLREWLVEWQRGMEEFARDTATMEPSEREAGAMRAGFRTCISTLRA